MLLLFAPLVIISDLRVSFDQSLNIKCCKLNTSDAEGEFGCPIFTRLQIEILSNNFRLFLPN